MKNILKFILEVEVYLETIELKQMGLNSEEIEGYFDFSDSWFSNLQYNFKD